MNCPVFWHTSLAEKRVIIVLDALNLSEHFSIFGNTLIFVAMFSYCPFFKETIVISSLTQQEATVHQYVKTSEL